ncbi:MAG: hypothetical protein PHH28_12295 [Desulfuromonadaceae bacterium]|nr:hypothetical protein [Desulfuromonadaceae bacterium]
MISHHKKSAWSYFNFTRILGAVAAASSLLATPLMAADNSSTGYYSLSGESDTVFRMRTNIEKNNIYPIYEYLHFDLTKTLKDGSSASFYLGGWGRADLADKSTDKYTDGDLQYGYLSYRAAKNNVVINLGRQFVTEGVATERLDGVYLHSDFAGGFGAAVYAGKPVITEPNFKGGNVVYGTRISQSDSQYYTVGLSALKSERENNSRYREEEGLDLWFHPLDQIDMTGRSTYNSITGGWMEHAYALSVIPLDQLRISADFSHVNYYDYFFNMTASSFSFADKLIDPNEKLTTAGVALSYLPIKNLTVIADYKLYNYEIARKAEYFGGKVTYTLPQSFAVGIGLHRMEGKADHLRYTEYRAYASKQIGRANVYVDFINLEYNKRINGVKNSYAVTGAAGYQFNKTLLLGASMEYSRNPEFDSELRGLLKITYAFDTRLGEGGRKNEK